MFGSTSSRSLARHIPRLLAGKPPHTATNRFARIPPDRRVRALTSIAANARPYPATTHGYPFRPLSTTAVLWKNRGSRSGDATPKEAGDALSRAGRTLESTGREVESAGQALGGRLATEPALAHSELPSPQPPPVPPPPPPRSSSSQSGGGFSATQFTTGSSLVDAFITTVIGLSMVFFGGIAYVAWYKANVLDKIELAFAAGYDPALELANRAKKHDETVMKALDWDVDGPWTQHLRREDQDLLDRIVQGLETGHYFMLLGPKGTGKTTMLYDAMQAIHAEGVSICEAHPDLEVFRSRLGKALNYEYHEDSQTGLFQRRDPREGGPALDIERALNKLEKVAIRYSDRNKRPLVLILNNVHFFKNDDDGKNMLLQFQQRAEAWAASGILTIVFSSDDFWPFFLMRKTASRMHVVSVRDLNPQQALRATMQMRMASHKSREPQSAFREVVGVAGGRLAYLNKIARHPDMVAHARHLLQIEKAWLQSQIGLIPDHDDDVMDEQKWSSCSWLLLREFVKKRQEQEAELQEQIAAGEKSPEAIADLPLPKIPYYQCRQIMTRPDFLEDLDRANIIAIDINHDVTPDSLLLLHAAREVVEEEGFDQQLDDVRERVDEIESLHRTRELTFKDVKTGDRIRLSVDKGGALLVEDAEQPS